MKNRKFRLYFRSFKGCDYGWKCKGQYFRFCTWNRKQINEYLDEYEKNVNNKSFDEKFKQRGILTSFSKIESGKIYLFVSSNCAWNWICEFYSVIPKTNQVEVVITSCLCSDGCSFSIFSPEDNSGLLRSEILAIYEATPDQINLLNSYRYEQPAKD